MYVTTPKYTVFLSDPQIPYIYIHIYICICVYINTSDTQILYICITYTLSSIHCLLGSVWTTHCFLYVASHALSFIHCSHISTMTCLLYAVSYEFSPIHRVPYVVSHTFCPTHSLPYTVLTYPPIHWLLYAESTQILYLVLHPWATHCPERRLLYVGSIYTSDPQILSFSMPIHSVLCIVFLPYLACYTLSPQVNYTSTPVCCPLHITPHTLCPIRSTHPLTIRCLLYIVPHACPIHYFLHQLPYIDSYTLPPIHHVLDAAP